MYTSTVPTHSQHMHCPHTREAYSLAGQKEPERFRINPLNIQGDKKRLVTYRKTPDTTLPQHLLHSTPHAMLLLIHTAHYCNHCC
jgi:hypothetical protein